MRHTGDELEIVSERYECEALGSKLEVALCKGEGQYKTTIGFLDCVIRIQARVHQSGKCRTQAPWDNHFSEWKDFSESYGVIGIIPVEVKITPVATGDIIRQINLYREYFKCEQLGRKNRWALLCDFDLSRADDAALKGEHIYSMRLGDRFEQFVADSKRAKPAEIERL